MYIINGKDNVGIVTEGKLSGHKIALRDINEGEEIIKYGFPIGKATAYIKKGDHVHTHNLKTALSGIDRFSFSSPSDPVVKDRSLTFEGYKRKYSRPGIRNDIFVIPTVGCVNGAAEKIAARTGATALCHPYGCSQLSDDFENTKKIICDIIKHPNAGGVLVLGLGCENNRINSLLSALGEFDKERVLFLEAQNSDNEIEEGISLVSKLKRTADGDVRQTFPVSELTIGLKCGGSDGFSGISANPLVGMFSDHICFSGGASILAEVPEMFGAEKVLLDRAASRDVFDKMTKMLDSFKRYYLDHGLPISENPSPGNRDGGITTLEEKSLGCVQKGGFYPVCDVLDYAEKVRRPGLNVLNTPGNDLVSSTAIAASGAQIVLFTTGRGTPYGTFVPTVKIATNTALFEKKRDWMDFDAGRMLSEDRNSVFEDLKSKIFDIINGKEKTRNEINGYSQIAIFKTGVTL